MKSIPRLNIHLRLQHLALLLAVSAGLLSGAAVTRGAAPGLGFDRLYHYHMYAGLLAAFIIGYHGVYLFVRGYVEGRNWPTFPMAWTAGDWKGFVASAGYGFGGGERPAPSGHFRYSQKAFYWLTAGFVFLLTVTGVLMGWWDSITFVRPLSFISLLASLHRGIALLFLAALLWHLYGALTWKGRLYFQWSWLNGRVHEDYAKEELPGFYALYLKDEEARKRAMDRQSEDEAEEEARRLERETVEEDLEEGNRLAREEKFVDALFHYRRALEKYPGYSQARFNMAVVLTRMGEKAMAREQFEAFVRDDPFHPLARKAQEHMSALESEES